ncbi:hypothetical protein H5410_044495 [Solanum commersonii]|uniref:Fatty acyl-CoA reductase C-terminal domain-containing protein n=1 Tax=Solanum commersonii TaxID=4109 RepID=A0A9J5X969_SOLCO|nr:hypothetical protein H5410_044495 [Solanum commersonii]
MVVNTTIAAMAKHGNLQNPQLNVYHVASSSINPLSFSQFFYYSYDFFKLFPFVNSKGDKKKILEPQDNPQPLQPLPFGTSANSTNPTCSTKAGTFDNGNVRKLMGDMSEEEKTSFEIDVTKINWRNYIENTHIPGVQKYVLEGKK